MEDLLGEDWQAPPKPATTTTTSTAPINPTSFASNYSSFRASPQPSLSGTGSPQSISRPSSTVNGAGTKTANDSFGNLLSLKSQKAGTSHLSIQERQKQILDEKLKQQAQQAQLWDTLGGGRGTPEARGASPALPSQQQQLDEEDDILAAFSKTAPVDNASYYPPPPASVGVSGSSTPAVALQGTKADLRGDEFAADDDPFGLGTMKKQGNGQAGQSFSGIADEDDDLLGDLGKPVKERASEQPTPSRERNFRDTYATRDNDRRQETKSGGIVELMEMGFPADTAQIALAENGGNVQAAVGWLLQQAHEESRQKAQTDAPTRQRKPIHGSRSPPRSQRARSEHDDISAWMRQDGRADSATRRQNSASPSNGERDAAQIAQDLGNKLFKGANSLWKASQKQMAKTMADFQQERDQSQPRWMQSAPPSDDYPNRRREDEPRSTPRPPAALSVTNEAAMLDMPRESRPLKQSRPQPPDRSLDSPLRGRSPAEPLPTRPSQQPKLNNTSSSAFQDRRPTTKLTRQENENQSADAYVSPARRKRATPAAAVPPEPEVDLFSPAPMPTPFTATLSNSRPTPKSSQGPRPTATPSKLPPPARSVPSISPAVLASSAKHRKTGGEAFRRGDYAAAHDSYSAALHSIPEGHPILIVILSNRALTALKIGNAKSAVSDADRALAIIGAGQGTGESIELGDGEGSKDMREFFGKALARKAEALEHMEKWAEAAAVWRQATEAGVGGAVALRSRDRCEKAAAPKPANIPAQRTNGTASTQKAPPPKSLGNSVQRPTLTSPASGEAVKKLRAANAAAEKADDEKFALTDRVDARLDAWKGGKADNLRALLQSLDTVLWEGAGWKKVGMSDLVMPNKVKIIYMKAIAKVHPDKIPQDATTEQRMVSAAVFSTLNEAWDKFKTDNNL